VHCATQQAKLTNDKGVLPLRFDYVFFVSSQTKSCAPVQPSNPQCICTPAFERCVLREGFSPLHHLFCAFFGQTRCDDACKWTLFKPVLASTCHWPAVYFACNPVLHPIQQRSRGFVQRNASKHYVCRAHTSMVRSDDEQKDKNKISVDALCFAGSTWCISGNTRT